MRPKILSLGRSTDSSKAKRPKAEPILFPATPAPLLSLSVNPIISGRNQEITDSSLTSSPHIQSSPRCTDYTT